MKHNTDILPHACSAKVRLLHSWAARDIHAQQMQQTQNVGGAALAECDTRSRHVNDTSQRSDLISSEVSVAGVISVWKRVAGMEVDFPEDLPTVSAKSHNILDIGVNFQRLYNFHRPFCRLSSSSPSILEMCSMVWLLLLPMRPTNNVIYHRPASG